MLFTGVILLILQGIFWMLEGCIDSYAARKNASVTRIFFLAAIMMVVLGAILFPFQKQLPDLENPTTCAMIAVLIANGVFAYLANYYLFVAMSRGPNGIIWAFYQAAMLFPFTLGILVHGDEATACRIAGITMLTAGLLAFGIGGDKKGNSQVQTGKGKWFWLIPTLASLITNGLSQYTNTIPSRYEEILPQLTDVTRSTLVYIGLALGCLVHAAFQKDLREFPTRKEFQLGILTGLLCIVGYYFLIFKGCDLLTKVGAGAIVYPIPVGVCVISFTAYSILHLHEKYTLLEWIGMLFCSAGVIVIIL